MYLCLLRDAQDALPDFPQCASKKQRIVHVGMGMSELLFAYGFKSLNSCLLVYHERNDGVGEKWYKTRHFGRACDVHSMQI